MNTVNVTLALGSAGLISCGVYLLLERSLTRALMGLILAGNGVALGFLVASGPAGRAPIMVDGVQVEDIADPLPQAMVLTAIVIMLATTAFVAAMAYRSWLLNGNDDVQDDPEDALIRRLATHDITSEAYTAESAQEMDDPEHAEDASDFTEGELEGVPVTATIQVALPLPPPAASDHPEPDQKDPR